MTDKPVRYVGSPDFHDGFIRALSQQADRVLVTVEGHTGKRYAVAFEGVRSVESYSPQDMMLHGLAEKDTGHESLRLYDFVNWYLDEPKTEESKSYLRIVAKGFTITDTD